MKNLYLIGARGMGRTLYSLLKSDPNNGKVYTVKGFLDDNISALDLYENYPPIISSVEKYEVQSNDLFLCSLGDVRFRKYFTEIIESKGGKFYTFIHPKARLLQGVEIGCGTIVCDYCLIGADAKIGKHCLLQSFSNVAHDVKFGDYSRLDTHAACLGGATIGNMVTIHTSSVINQKGKVGNEAIVGAMSFVPKRVKEGIKVYGNPAKKLKI